MNAGERNEILVKMRLVQLRDSNNDKSVLKKITSVGFGGNEYGKLPAGTNLAAMSDIQIESLAKSIGINKAGRFDKADVYIDNVPYSIKSLQTAPPALVNHTARDGWERVCSAIGCTIDKLDTIVKEYWELRKSNKIKEDIPNNEPNSPFKNEKDYMLPILNYFLFKGTGSRDSKHPADCILDFTDPLDINTWNVYGDDYLDSHWDNLIFCIRSKKGMGNYPKIKNAKKKSSMAKWTEYFLGEYRGALHVRVK